MTLALMRDRDPRFRFLGWRVGLTGFALLIMLLALAAFLGERSGLFEHKTRVHLVAENGTGLLPGLQVRLSGFRIGVIDEVQLNSEARVDVELLIETRYMKWVKTDALAILQQDGLVGDHFIEIAGGSAKAAPLAEDGVLTFVPAMSFADIAQDLRNRTLPLLDEFQKSMLYVNDPQGDVRKTVANIQTMTAEMRETRKQLDALLANVNTLADKDVRQTLVQTRELLLRADAMAAEVQQHLPAMLADAASGVRSLQQTAADASATMQTLRRTSEQVAPQMPGILRNADNLLYDADYTLQGVQQSWPLRSMLPPPPGNEFIPESRP
ncbi:MlaD family protein [Chitinilyticum aquatile]|uniref:MlaD family protein n=1 Tax=Chitinilyticum aquatile TaxID=362520 RepID=UPI00041B1430|nr:MlaD family protein [Chitinilyticum aquatile]